MLSKYLKAFTLVEMLVALAVSSIIIGATYSSYQMVAEQYKKNMDVADMHTSGRAIMRIIERDIRMAGFEYRDADAKVTYGSISNPLIPEDDDDNECCDKVTVIYDYFDEETQKAERLRIRYWAEAYSSNKGARHRLYKQKDILGQNKKILTKPILGKKEVMADYIEALQFESDIGKSSGGCTPKDGWFCPASVTTSCNSSDTNNIIDGNNKTTWKCDSETTITLNFGQKISKITNITMATGSLGDADNPPWSKNAIGGSGTLYWKGKKLYDVSYGRYGPPKNSSAFGPCNDNLHWSFKQNIGGKDCSGVSEIKFKVKKSNLCIKWRTHKSGSLKGQKYCYQHKSGIGKSQLGLFKVKGEMMSGSNKSLYSSLDSELVRVELILRTKNQYGKDRQFKKKDYHGGNFKLDKTDKYKRDTFSSTVLVRNLAL